MSALGRKQSFIEQRIPNLSVCDPQQRQALSCSGDGDDNSDADDKGDDKSGDGMWLSLAGQRWARQGKA